MTEFTLTEEQWTVLYDIGNRKRVRAITFDEAFDEAKELLLPEIAKLLIQNSLEKALDEHERTA